MSNYISCPLSVSYVLPSVSLCLSVFSSMPSPRYLTCWSTSPVPRPVVSVCVVSHWLCPNSGAASSKDPSFAARKGMVLQRDLQAASACCEIGWSTLRRISWLRHQMSPPACGGRGEVALVYLWPRGPWRGKPVIEPTVMLSILSLLAS